MVSKIWHAPVSLEMFGPGHYRVVAGADLVPERTRDDFIHAAKVARIQIVDS